MGDKDTNNQTSATLLKWVVIFLLALIAYQVFSGETLKKVNLFQGEIEFFDRNKPPSEPDQQTYEPDADDETISPQLTSINLAYGGDFYSCTLPLNITIANTTVVPTSNFYQVNNIPTGNQNYSISGQVNCPSIGNCNANGSGTIHVQPGGVFNIIWQNTSFGSCKVSLQ